MVQTIKENLELRRRLKRKKPSFSKQDAHKKSKLASNWRKPRGLQSKMRLQKKGYCRSVSVGWKSPAVVKALSREGFAIILVSNLSQLNNIDSKKEIIEISSTVGLKKKLLIVEDALNKNIQISNLKEPKKFLEETKAEITAKKADKDKKKKERDTRKEKKAEEKKKKEEEKKKAKVESEEKEKTEEDKKVEEKKEKDKVLIQKK